MGVTYHPNGLRTQFWIVTQFGAASYETQRIEGHWQHGQTIYRDNLVRLVIDAPDNAKNRQWMKGFKQRWMTKLEQSDLWMISYLVTIE